MIRISNSFFSIGKKQSKVITTVKQLEEAIGYGLNIKEIEGQFYMPVLLDSEEWTYAPVSIINAYLEEKGENQQYILYEDAAKKLKITTYTLNRWYRWFRNRKEEDLERKIPILPPTVTIKKKRYFRMEDLNNLKLFKKFYNKNWGMMRREYLKNEKKPRSKERGFNKELI